MKRDPETGELIHKVCITVRTTDRPLSFFVNCANWASAVAYLDSDEFKDIAHTVEHLTINNREIA